MTSLRPPARSGSHPVRRVHGFAIALLAGVFACGEDRPGAPAREGGAVSVLGEAPEFALLDQQGDEFRSADLRGKLWVADFVFTRCTSMCPRLTAAMAKLQGELSGKPLWDQVRLVSFSVDPEHDRPDVLAEYAERYQADRAHWTFATGTREEIWGLSVDGFKLPVGSQAGDADQPLFHSDRFVLVDRQGRIRGYYPALEPEGIPSLIDDLNAVAREDQIRVRWPSGAEQRVEGPIETNRLVEIQEPE